MLHLCTKNENMVHVERVWSSFRAARVELTSCSARLVLVRFWSSPVSAQRQSSGIADVQQMQTCCFQVLEVDIRWI